MQFKKISILITCLLILLVSILTIYFSEQYLLLSTVFVLISILPFLLRFENKKIDSRYIVLIAILVAIATVGRVLFAPFPNIKPTSFVIIMAGFIFGGEIGFMVGAITALVSNLFFGQGPWTVWQMLAWGTMGFSCGILRNTIFFKNFKLRILFGFIWGFLFGWIMDLWFILGISNELTFEAFFVGFLSSFYFDLVHGISNAIMIALFSSSWIKILERIKTKYGMVEKTG